jgi:septum site-determining protein MinD
VILIASGKGGVGKSVFTSNIGATYADRGLRTALIDMNVGLRNLDIYMGLENKVIFDTADVIDGVVSVKKALVRDKRFQELYLLATTQKKEKFKAEPADITKLYKYFRENFDITLVDGPAGVTDDLKLAATDVDAAVLVATPEYVSLRDADMVDQTLRKCGVKQRVYIVNKVNKLYLSSGILPTVEVITSIMKIPLLGVVQFDDNIHLSANCGIPIVYGQSSYIERNFHKIADRLLNY